MTQEVAQEFLYRVPWRSRSINGGNHAGSHIGGGIEFHSHASLANHPDVRHLDLQTSLRDPFGQYQVKRYRQDSSLNLVVIADLSASLHSFNKYPLLIDICRSIAWSANRNGDRFAFYAGAEKLDDSLYSLPTRHYNTLHALWEALEKHTPSGQHSRGLLDADEQLPTQRSLVFLISDFHLPIAEIEQLLARLDSHDVVPIVLWHDKEYRELPQWRFVSLRDPETQQLRNLWMRPALHQSIQQRFAEHREAITQCCYRFGRSPLFVGSEYKADQMTDYFLGMV